MGRIEELAAQNLKLVPENPCELWDLLISEKMLRDGCSRSAAVDRVLSTHQGSAAWQACCSYDAAVPKTVIQNGVPVKTGNWRNGGGSGTIRRIPRAP